MKYFLEIFRSPRDIHRVVLAGILSLLLSHVVYLYESTAQNVSIVHTNDYILLAVFWSLVGFCGLWCVFSSERNFMLYGRIAIISLWSILFHRLIFGVESAGSVLVNIAFVVGWSAWLPFALAGMGVDEFMLKIGMMKKRPENSNVIQYQRANND